MIRNSEQGSTRFVQPSIVDAVKTRVEVVGVQWTIARLKDTKYSAPDTIHWNKEEGRTT